MINIRSASLWAGHTGRHTVARQLSYISGVPSATNCLTYLRNRKFGKQRRMMVDSGATTKASMVDVLPEKDDNGGYASGEWKSEDGSLSCGYSSFRGKRASMEDFYDIKAIKIEGQSVCLFGVFDGHGGSRAAEFLKEHLFENLMRHPEFITNTKLAISETYQQTDIDFLESEKDTFRDDGSTASTAVLVANHLYVANVGDSRTIISKAGKAIPLSEDHKPNRSDERKRIESAGGIVMWAGTWRVGGVLAMSRAFGNRMLKQYVVAEPEIQEQEVDQDLDLLVLASDGLWDVIPNEDAVSIAQTEEEAEAAARKLTETAFTRGSADNVTCIVVKFHHGKTDTDETQQHLGVKPQPKETPKPVESLHSDKTQGHYEVKSQPKKTPTPEEPLHSDETQQHHGVKPQPKETPKPVESLHSDKTQGHYEVKSQPKKTPTPEELLHSDETQQHHGVKPQPKETPTDEESQRTSKAEPEEPQQSC